MEDNERVPKRHFDEGERVQISFFTTKEINEKLKNVAKLNRLSKSQLIENALLDFSSKYDNGLLTKENLPQPPQTKQTNTSIKDLVQVCLENIAELKKVIKEESSAQKNQTRDWANEILNKL